MTIIDKNIKNIKEIVKKLDFIHYWDQQPNYKRQTGSNWAKLYQKQDQKELKDLLIYLEKQKEIVLTSENEVQIVGVAKNICNSLYDLADFFSNDNDKLTDLSYQLNNLTYKKYPQGYGFEYQ